MHFLWIYEKTLYTIFKNATYINPAETKILNNDIKYLFVYLYKYF